MNGDSAPGSLLLLAREHLDCDRAGIAVRDSAGAALTLVASDDVVSAADRLQSFHADGPSVTPAWSTPQVAVADVALGGPWPVWSRALAELGIASVLATQIITHLGQTGALTLYSHRRFELDAHLLAMASMLARQAASELRHAHEAAHLQAALDSRTPLGQAQGILMERLRISGVQAFDVFRRHSQDTNTKLRAVAESVVDTGELGAYVEGRRR